MTRSFWGGSGYLIPGDAEQGTSTTRQWCSARLCTGNTGKCTQSKHEFRGTQCHKPTIWEWFTHP